MKLIISTVTLPLLTALTVDSFSPALKHLNSRHTTLNSRFALKGLLANDDDIERVLDRQLVYKAGGADSELSRRFGNLTGKKVKTVGEAFADFTEALGHPINALYKNMLTDIVGSTHLTMVNARFQRDPIWSLGMISSMELLLKNYPEQHIADDIISSLIKSMGLEESEVRAEAKFIMESLEGMEKDDIATAMRGEGNSPIATIAKNAKDDDYWMYSRFFGLGLLKIMEVVGVDMSMESCYMVMEEWVGKSLEKPFYTACSDSDQWFGVKSKLSMMETLMKEIEIREKKKQAQRLEDRAEAAIRQAERDAKMAAEIAMELA
mmetsp:Transcript_34727/g.50986  ORF Transcript_34727/g.50986 Transcript_34727/m.50986 type:complete len:321 (+) Transcript_34727:165-1127(+)|eukprot:CAMPEP_0195508720 /NCGR_PEP_ID=MMETSP0794_2-20130614/1855_1 /TAXON_ID=515487 /ORGANISM="Stephanopyxis turris, Strain CCMP 815" /LENGTH=320 /DNA_ID=CAMNT_0040635753 /DNA_START=100 /DNA_END=1062 /DNA_ORIENTATION=+